MKKYARLLAAIALMLIASIIITGCGANKSDSCITDDVLAEFQKIANIPRPSGNEKEISDYLKSWAEGKGLNTVQDDYYNIIFDVPATKGFEKLPLTVLQCHMDMVFTQKGGLDLNPLTTCIKTVNDGTYLSSDGNTSLGADDGIGLSIALCIADGKMEHGPLRIIITADEEEDSTGVFNIDPKYVSDVINFINIDNNIEGNICVSSASADLSEFSAEFDPSVQSKTETYRIEIKGLAGGHSGDDIDKNRLNGGIEIGAVLRMIMDRGIDFELKFLKGGDAVNAIMAGASSEICIDMDDAEKLEDIVSEYRNSVKERAVLSDPDAEIILTKTDSEIDFVLPNEIRDAILSFLGNLKNGINTMSKDIEGLVESSSNLGLIKADPEMFSASVFTRSCSVEILKELLDSHEALADCLGFDYSLSHSGDAWEYKQDNSLIDQFAESYRSIFDCDVNVSATHGCLECGTFAEYNRNMNMVSVGVTILEEHSVAEKVDLASIEKLWLLIEDVFAKQKKISS